MAKGTFQVSAKRLLGLCLMIFGAVSCTYDYFEDETNFRLHVPQIENNEISRFCVVFHDANGKHIRTRLVEAPFDRDDLTKQGILRFKLFPGEYHITCFAEYAEGSISEGESFVNSYKKALLRNPGTGSDNVYTPYNSNTRALFLEAVTAFPAGHPSTQIPVEANIDENHCFKGQVTSNFIDLPDIIKRIDISATGLSTKFKFDGLFDHFTASDRLAVSLNTAQMSPGTPANSLSNTDYLIPSVGINFKNYLDGVPYSSALSMDLQVDFYDANNVLMGSASVSDADLATLENDKRPTDGNGNLVSNLILEPQKRLIFTFKGFTLFQVQLAGWGDIVPGQTTPM